MLDFFCGLFLIYCFSTVVHLNKTVVHMDAPIIPKPANVANVAVSLVCPVYGTPLTDAVMLTPCGHTVSEVAASRLYHGMRDEAVANSVPCPLCRRVVKAFYPNQIVRAIAEETLGHKLPDVLPAVSAAIQADEAVNIDAIPFPGRGAKFVSSGDWNQIVDYPGLVRELRFESHTSSSLFGGVVVLGRRTGQVVIAVMFNEHKKIAANYLSKCGIPIGPEISLIGEYYSDTRSLKPLFKILAKHNEFPADIYPLLCALVEAGDWTKVTPLADPAPRA
jgi:hypothetical protein